jgi:hypothetical protein
MNPANRIGVRASQLEVANPEPTAHEKPATEGTITEHSEENS